MRAAAVLRKQSAACVARLRSGSCRRRASSSRCRRGGSRTARCDGASTQAWPDATGCSRREIPGTLCRSCRLTRTRAGGLRCRSAWPHSRKAEAAKRRLLFGLLELGLEVDEGGLSLSSAEQDPIRWSRVTPNGVVTIDLAESDDARREQRRAKLGEPYRTLLGHFRHESAHYYWPGNLYRLFRFCGLIEICRMIQE